MTSNFETTAEVSLEEASIRFRSEIDAVINTPFFGGELEGYTETALNGVIEVIEEALPAYRSLTGDTSDDRKQQEQDSFRLFGLDEIPVLLDRISQINDGSAIAKNTRARAVKHQDVFVPPDSKPAFIGNGGPETYEPRLFPRTETILFLLHDQLGVDIEDRDQVRIDEGSVTDEMVRNEPYVHISVPSLDRSILVCDEEGNRTFVMSTSRLVSLGVPENEIVNLGKQRIREIILQNPEAGLPIEYRAGFIPNVIRSLKSDLGSIPRHVAGETSAEPSELSLLKPLKDTEGYTRKKAAKALGISISTVIRIAQSEAERIGPVTKAAFHNKEVDVFSEDQLGVIRAIAHERGLFSPRAKEGDIKVTDYAAEVKIKPNKLLELLAENTEAVGVIRHRRYGELGKPALTITAEQMDAVNNIPEVQRKKAGIPEQLAEDASYDSLNAFAEDIGVDKTTVRVEAQALGIKLEKHRSGRNIIKDDDALAIMSSLEKRGLVNNERPEGILSASGMAAELGVNPDAVEASLKRLGIDPAQHKKYRFGVKLTTGYDKAVQRQVKKDLEEHAFFRKIPVDVKSTNGLVQASGASRYLVDRAIQELKGQLDSVVQYRFGANLIPGYNASEQRLILETVRSYGGEADLEYLDELSEEAVQV